MSERAEMVKEQSAPGRFGRGIRLIGRVSLTLAVIAGAGFAVQIGAAELARSADAAPAPDAAPLIPVSTRPLQREDSYEVTRSFVGQVEPQKTVSVSFELPGRLDEIVVDEGDRVTKGQILARQDLSLLNTEQSQLTASKAATAAQLRFAIQTVARSEELNKRGFTSQAGLDEVLARQDELRSRIAEIDAGLDSVAIRMEKSTIKAPFDGRITERRVDGGETLGAGQMVLGIIELRQPQVRVGVPLDLTEQDLAQAQIEIAGAAYPARLATLRADIDPITRTRTALFEIETAQQPAFGQTAQLILTRRIPADGLWVPMTSLKEGVRGQWTILTVDPEDIVRATVVEVLHAESDRVFVRGGFPEKTRLIHEGPQRVTIGQRVQPAKTL